MAGEFWHKNPAVPRTFSILVFSGDQWKVTKRSIDMTQSTVLLHHLLKPEPSVSAPDRVNELDVTRESRARYCATNAFS